MKDNKNTKVKTGSCSGSNQPTEIINNYINQREEIIIESEEIAPQTDEDIFE